MITNLNRDKVIELAKAIARDQGFAVHTKSDGAFNLRKGNPVVGILAAPVAPYCNFSLLIENGRDGTEVILERNTPWWGGVVAVNQVQKRAETLIDDIAGAVEGQGGKIVKRAAF